jgi:hypothetical protein
MSDHIFTWGTGTYALTSLMNHLNQEKASLLEKVEHYERDLVPSNPSSGYNTHSSSSSIKNNHRISNGLRNDSLDSMRGDSFYDLNSSNDGFYNNNNSYEFYYEKNIRP